MWPTLMTHPSSHVVPRPIVWTIAGSDPGGGAGIQADLKTMNGLGVHACSVITALTVQNTTGVFRVAPVAPDLLRAQLAALAADLPPAAIKIGMLATAGHVRIVADFLRQTDAFVVCDPVLAATRGTELLEMDGLQQLIGEILPRADVTTPNLAEFEVLGGASPRDMTVSRTAPSPAAIAEAAGDVVRRGARSLLVKGGHGGTEFSQDYWTNGRESFWLTSPRQHVRHTHGTGCTLSAAIAAAHALGLTLTDALVLGKTYLNQGLRQGDDLGQGHGPLAHLGWPEDAEDLPWATPTAEAGRTRLSFPSCGPAPLGLYPIVDRATWLEKLLPLGITTIQLRAKDLAGAALDKEVRSAIEIARRFDARLFVNDAWELALQHGAYGVHLGQQDARQADLAALARAGLRLGLSAHNHFELAVANAARPSYIGLGPVFPTVTKQMAATPLGVDGFRRLRRLAGCPVAAIGGLAPEHMPALRAAGADGFSVISDLLNASDPLARAAEWLQVLARADAS
ncbi:MAG: bifunctional hydroxymethylpyrimidine kinase/phosphomethylpyrimidine kinase [Kiritimatiellaeota bacterium]|nr:bifunctional hydroxymethylpyrimidine kinase/phosphomethylpyrimidine kinase [Kiritimatiellota bacterium]